MKLHFSHRIDKKNLENFYALTIIIFLVLISIRTKDVHSTFGLLDVPKKETGTSTVVFSFTPIPAQNYIQAKTYVVYDVLNQKVLLGKDESQVVALASMTKLMTAITAKEIASGDTVVKVIPEAIEGGYDIGLKNGQLWKLDELIKYMLVFSSNDIANLISVSLVSRADFIATMNTIAKREGMNTLHFTNPNGLDNGKEFGGAGSALDVAKLMAYAYRKIPTLLDATTKSRATVVSSSGPLRGVPNTNQIVDKFIGVEGSKTGFTDEAGGNLVMIFDVTMGHPIVIVVTGSTRADRFTDVEKLYESTKNALR